MRLRFERQILCLLADSIKHFTGFDINGKNEDEIRAAALEMGIEVDETMGKGKLIDEIFGEKCEGNYIQPTFITDYPKEMSPLCKEHRDNPELTERFELMVCGKEIANAYSELNDPIDQRERFEAQAMKKDAGDEEACGSKANGLENPKDASGNDTKPSRDGFRSQANQGCPDNKCAEEGDGQKRAKNKDTQYTDKESLDKFTDCRRRRVGINAAG